MFSLMIDKLVERKRREADAISGRAVHTVPEEQLFSQAGIKVKKVKRGDNSR